jgi:hypothetical protein
VSNLRVSPTQIAHAVRLSSHSLQCDCIIAGLVPCSKKQRDGLALELIEQAADRRLRRGLFEFGIISGPEFLPTSWIAMEAVTKRGAWGDFF